MEFKSSFKHMKALNRINRCPKNNKGSYIQLITTNRLQMMFKMTFSIQYMARINNQEAFRSL